MKGYIHSIETFGTADDGGIRYILFMQGCAMRCAFCQNPDTWLKRGRPMTTGEVLRDLQQYRLFLDLSGGGLTVSGGEPLLQWRFVRELFEGAGRDGFHCTLDTSGYCRHGQFASVLEKSHRILFSLKVIDPIRHLQLTGVDNAGILENLRLAGDSESELVVRYVYIPGINDSPADIAILAEVLLGLGRPPYVEILPYHRLGMVKWEQLGMQYALKGIREPGGEEIGRAGEYLARRGLRLW